jgi:hypothetical protein
MNDTAMDIYSIIEPEANFAEDLDCEIVEYDFRHRNSLSEIFNEEIDAWARHCLASNGFGDY